MAAKIKLQRIGSKNRPYYRVVIQDESASPGGKVVEVLGRYQTLSSPMVFEVDKEKTLAWIKRGAKPTEKVRILLGKAGVLPPIDLSSLPKKKPKAEKPPEEKVKEEVKEEKAKEEAPKEGET